MIDGKHYSDNNEAALSMGQMTYGIPLTELTNAYTVFPNDGILNSPRSYYGVFDEKGRVILENNTESKRIYREETARIMNQLLAGVVECGTARSISLKNMIDTAGKTGTSSMNKDRLFVGYTPYVSAGIWVGYQNGSSVNSLTKSHLELWDEVMKRIHNEVSFVERDKEFKTFSVKGLEVLKICKRSGLLATPDCDERDTEIGYFKRHNAPIEFCESC